jgi:uncharacterized protein (UPF0276 family)
MSPPNSPSHPQAATALPDKRWSGIGLRQPHYAQLLSAPVPLAFVEVHSENFFGNGGAALGVLRRARECWPVSLHGVGLALGSAAGLDPWHLDRLAALVKAVQPVRVSDHACFARAPRGAGHADVVHASDLLPIAFTESSLQIMATHAQQVQDRLQRPLLVENLSAYLHWADNTLPEPEFFNRLTRQTGCGLLLDVNNLVVNALNAQREESNNDPGGGPRVEAAAVQAACQWVDAIDPHSVGEIHLAGYTDAGDIVIDDHGSRVRECVWQVYGHALQRLGPRPTLVEWDADLPALDVLLAQADRAEHILAAAAAAQAIRGPVAVAKPDHRSRTP